MEEIAREDYDSPWKAIIERFFERFMAFYFQRAHRLIAIVTLAHLKAIETRRAPNARMKAKLELIRLLRDRKEMRRDVIDLLRFIDWELILPQNMERELRETIRRENKEMGKPYVSSWERMAMREGHIMGALETLRANITEILEIRFGALPAEIAGIIGGIDEPEILQELHRQAVKCESLDAFAEHLPATV